MMASYTLGESDRLFLERFEALQLEAAEFDHLAHLRLAFLYLSTEPFELAVIKISKGIKFFAEHHGAKQKYHCTITVAIIYIMAQRMRSYTHQHFDGFIEKNTDLLHSCKSLLDDYYSAKLLNTAQARKSFLQPDKKPFPQERLTP